MKTPIVKNSKTILLLAPIDKTSSAIIHPTYAQFSMANYQIAVIDVICGVLHSTGNAAVTLIQGTGTAAGTPKALAFSKVWVLNPADNSPATDADKWVETAVTSNTYNIAYTDDGKIFRHEIRADDLDVSGGYDCAGIDITAMGSSNFNVCIVVNLFNPRYYGGTDTSRTPDALA